LIEIKTLDYPVKTFAGTLCAIGGNWIGDKAADDRDPRGTFLREACEELSFEKPLVNTAEMEALGLSRLTTYQVMACKAKPEVRDMAALDGIKQAIRERARHVVDSIQYVPKSVFDRHDPENKRGDVKTLNSFFAVALDDPQWKDLVRLQETFGNLSNESVSFLTSINQLIETRAKISWGYDRILQYFFFQQGCAAAKDMHLIPGVEVQFLPGGMLPSYFRYMREFNVARHP
jgi:hypothetical protein